MARSTGHPGWLLSKEQPGPGSLAGCPSVSPAGHQTLEPPGEHRPPLSWAPWPASSLLASNNVCWGHQGPAPAPPQGTAGP